ncbi:MAG: methyltransferase domain-containing protein [Thermodesulfobacteriota bacterium]
MRSRFSRAAATYDEASDVQRAAVDRLASLWPPAEGVRRILELGCGTGLLTELLLHRFPRARVVAVDFSLPMLTRARARARVGDGRVDFVCADGEEFVAGSRHSFDLVTSNAALQWFADPEKTLERLPRLISGGGRLVFSCFGPGTLTELDQALAATTGRSIAAAGFTGFAAMERWLRSSFARVEGEIVNYRRHHADVRALLRSLRDTGTAVPVRGGRPLTPGRLRALDHWFRAHAGGCRVTYEVFFFRCSP